MDSRFTQCSTGGNTLPARPCTVDLPANVTSFAWIDTSDILNKILDLEEPLEWALNYGYISPFNIYGP